MFQLNTLISTVKKRKRVGRGGSRGGTSGKGHKGQSARSGGAVRVGFEGGQMSIFRRLPRRGFTNARFRKLVKTVSIQQIDAAFDEGMQVDKETLIEKGLVKVKRKLSSREPFLLKILGDGILSKKLTICADAFSKSARKAIEDSGGEVRLIKEI